ncbi:hypothetical protein JCM18694_09770 [Prolixibacter denitrificans]|uniref:PKD domain-containing protein n=2 Tax=Prolixibacter denitrificans TaxID=1541063 RepID=A0ABQ0ZH00_9BACT|nr:hypothetical protein JCM18694_09770 [Prolixibacter denitrificans]
MPRKRPVYMKRSILFLLLATISLLTTAQTLPFSLTDLNESGNPVYAPEMIVSGETIHTIWITRNSDNTYTMNYRRSTDSGVSWETTKVLFTSDIESWQGMATSNNFKRLAIDRNKVFVMIQAGNVDDKAVLYLTSSTDGGVSFSTPKPVYEGDVYNSVDHSFVQYSNGTLYNVFVTHNNNNGATQFYLLSSTNDGADVTLNPFLAPESWGIDDFLADGNDLYILYSYAYYYYGFNYGNVKMAVSHDGGATFSETELSVPAEGYTDDRHRASISTDRRAPLIAKSGSTVSVIWTLIDSDEKTHLRYARSADNGDTFSTPVSLASDDDVAGTINGQRITIATLDEDIFIIFPDYIINKASSMYLITSNDNGNSFSSVKTLNTDYSYPKGNLPLLSLSPNKVAAAWSPGVVRYSTDKGETFDSGQMLYPYSTYMYDMILRDFVSDEDRNVRFLGNGRISSDLENQVIFGRLLSANTPSETNSAFTITRGADNPSYLEIPETPEIAIDSAITIEFWTRIDITTEGSSSFILFEKLDSHAGSADRQFEIEVMRDYNTANNPKLRGTLITDKGTFVIEAKTDLYDDKWHHIGYSYDARAGLKNYKLFVDGKEVASKTVTGKIEPEPGVYIFGPYYLSNPLGLGLDEIRIWEKGFNQEEMAEKATHIMTGTEDKLLVYINCNESLKDLTGHGADGFNLVTGEFTAASPQPPVVAFEAYKNIQTVSFNQKSENATQYSWDFGDGETSDLANPTHEYSGPGEYNVTLTASNNGTSFSATKTITIEGIARIEDDVAGNTGYATVKIYGGGLTDNSTFKITMGGEEVVAEEISLYQPGVLIGTLDLHEKAVGKWDVVVQSASGTVTIPEGFTVVEGEEASPWVEVQGRGRILFNMWQTYTIRYGNDSNVDAMGVPLFLVVPWDTEVELIDFTISFNGYAESNGEEIPAELLQPFYETDQVMGEEFHAKVYPFYVPIIPANSSNEVHIRLKSPSDIRVLAWVSEPFFGSPMDEEIQDCLLRAQAGAVANGLVNLAASALPGAGCVKDVVTTYIWNPLDFSKPKADEKPTWGSMIWNYAKTVASCAVDFVPAAKAYELAIGVFQFGADIYDNYQKDQECRKLAKQSKNDRGITAVSSFDPNEIVGPDGPGAEKYIAETQRFPYTIYFENKSSASAPAHIVTVTDTLDLARFRASDFTFGSFGFGDTIITPNTQETYSFSSDVELNSNLLLRVTGKVDTLTGVISWQFASLDPLTMDIHEDPQVGFLPPNVTSPEGEGFVSFTVGVHEPGANGTTYENQATIVFDANEPIKTNVWHNTVDVIAPESQVEQLDAETGPTTFTVTWSGTDNAAGIEYYDIYVKVNDEDPVLWLVHTKETSAEFVGEVGDVYKFYSVATDNVGNTEEASTTYDAETLVTSSDELISLNESWTLFPNPTNGELNLSINDMEGELILLEIYSATGNKVFERQISIHGCQQNEHINLNRYPSGIYIARLTVGNEITQKSIILK